MKFVADESIDRPIVERLRQENYQVWYIAEMSPSISDEKVLKSALNEQALLLTADKDFGELVFRQQLGHLGVVLIRLAGLSPELKANLVVSTINNYLSELPYSFIVISPGRIRIHRGYEE